MPSRLTDEAWLRERVAAYASNVEIAAEAGVTTRAVRYALHRYNIERAPRIDLAAVVAVAEYQAGTPLADIAVKVNRGTRWVSKAVQAAGAQRPANYRRRRPKYPQLGDADWPPAVGAPLRTLGAARPGLFSAGSGWQPQENPQSCRIS